MPVTLSGAIVRRRCAALIPYARNARTHSNQQVAQIAASIREFGSTNPVLIDEEDGIIAGAGRVLAAHLLGLDEVPCIVQLAASFKPAPPVPPKPVYAPGSMEWQAQQAEKEGSSEQ